MTQLDDTLSMVKNMDYFGKTTKQAKGKEFFTIPVKLAYKDKETRIAAEQNLRKLCKVSCTTPYHNDVEKIPLPDSFFDLTHKVSRHVPSKPEGMDLDVRDSTQG